MPDGVHVQGNYGAPMRAEMMPHSNSIHSIPINTSLFNLQACSCPCTDIVHSSGRRSSSNFSPGQPCVRRRTRVTIRTIAPCKGISRHLLSAYHYFLYYLAQRGRDASSFQTYHSPRQTSRALYDSENSTFDVFTLHTRDRIGDTDLSYTGVIQSLHWSFDLLLRRFLVSVPYKHTAFGTREITTHCGSREKFVLRSPVQAHMEVVGRFFFSFFSFSFCSPFREH
ncbi:hypothetical protein BO78DRAFT_142006 [Aspergillus sclerotiicarbonarius CBS 121057]|uniref:Uncharacterized protein n=1 Tax=Aspergillus sclerotiicarbonarius (strain CBS 121057 / IBT 28362) TaxID=1448318 RepID=A0A319ED77_ASPSB|nr:hypothetical protein BO78DRAFT_142006 [Aspergillus sclerotiicarbonarius CBS 121057]